MKKVKLIGTLLAAVIAAAPVTGFTGNVLSFNDNAIVAEAASGTPSEVEDKEYGRSDSRAILRSQNGKYELFFLNNGSLVIKEKGKIYNVILAANSANKTLYFQGDANLVTYNKNYYSKDYSRPVFHSNTWMFNTSNPRVKFSFELLNNGELRIKRTFLSGQFAGNYDYIWSSNRNRMYKV
ncbi:hypothetical protein [Ruminococcus flavefaciens]|uniref:hypothetical protein n=1 Tax=Ruminococcus flavefaciens TaxID=1265 RepID=UPI000464E9D4|nr:hypothetical protein [Ruminococcus flavefaciens]